MKKIIICLALTNICLLNAIDSQHAPDLAVGTKAYIPMKYLIPGQVRYSQKNVELKVTQAMMKYDYLINDDGSIILAHDNGRSAVPHKKIAPVMKVRNQHGEIRYVLADNHHRTLANKHLAKNAHVDNPTMPIVVQNDFTNMNWSAFWYYAHHNGLVDLMRLDGSIGKPLTSLDEMIEDPIRYFVSISAFKVIDGPTLQESQRPAFPLWVKVQVNSDNPKNFPGDSANKCMLENRVAQKLRDGWFQYTYGDEISNMEAKVIEAHEILMRDPEWVTKTGLRIVQELGSYNTIHDHLCELAARPDPLRTNN